jgi:hypothetical protein
MIKSQAWWSMTVIPAIGEGEARESQVQGQPGLHSEFEISLVYTVRTHLKTK